VAAPAFTLIPATRPEPAFLGVEKSARGLRWVERLPHTDAHKAAAISQRHGLPDIIGRILAARDCTVEDVAHRLNPTMKVLCPNPATFAGMAEGAERLADAIVKREQVAIFGDYDVDGACSSALLHRFLAFHGIDGRIYIPDRMTEGYGPNVDAIHQLADAGASLIVTVDCGSVAVEPLQAARDRGVDVVVLDHHQLGEILPPCHALVNPNRVDCASGQGHLCAAGVVFLTLIAVKQRLKATGTYRTSPEPDLMRWLDLVALATVCDVVPLIGVNRAFVVQGLKVMAQGHTPGIAALCQAAQLNKAPTPYSLGFVLGPRINAGGRIGDSSLGARLLATDNAAEAREMAATLDSLNRQRREIERQTVEEAMGWAYKALLDDPDCPIVIAGSTGWHKGLVGLVASRLTERCQRPALIFANDEIAGEATGSARSVAGVDIGAAIRGAVETGLALKGGGHAMAAGVTIKTDRLSELSAYLRSALSEAYGRASRAPSLAIDGALLPRAATPEFVKLLEQAGPYGQGNAAPRFVIPCATANAITEIGGGHMRLRAKGTDGSEIAAVAFRAANSPVGALMSSLDGMPVHLAGRVECDEWGGRTRIEFHIEDAAPAS
jgi:single-stranded-DNA-specific exonuclease